MHDFTLSYLCILNRNASDPISINELSMFVNALAVTCHNPRRFYGYDLLQILNDGVASAESPIPSAYLTLCNLNWTLSDSDLQNLVNLLYKNKKYPFHSGKIFFYLDLLLRDKYNHIIF